MTTVANGRQTLSILVVDDEAIVRESLGGWLRQDGHRVDTAESARQALRLVAHQEYDIALLDIKMPSMDGLELQSRLREAAPDLTVIITTAYASVETAVQALKQGAYDYIVKPFDPDDLSCLIRRATDYRSLHAENIKLKERVEQAAAPSPIVGSSAAMRCVLDLVETVAASDTTVLIQGESGTGKELVAHAIHAQSARRYNRCVKVHCGALAEGLLESELFGHEQGAFTGASYQHKGKFEQADGGTVFLDEIGDITPRVQVGLLKVLEEKRVTRVGGQRSIPVDFRVIAATNRDLRAMVRVGEFREDLFWRLDVVTIDIPPLRERLDDIPVLAEYFLERFTQAMSRKRLTFSREAMAAIQSYSWPGNVRELQNAVERAVVLGSPPTVEVRDLPHVLTGTGAMVRTGSLADVERIHVKVVLDQTGWNISRAARVLGVDRGTLYNKIRKYSLTSTESGQKRR